MRTKTLLAFVGLSTGASAYLFIQAFLYSPVWPDTGYFLPMAERISEGLRPFRDLGVQHTSSLMFIYAALPTLLGPEPRYEIYLMVSYLVCFGVGGLLWAMSKRISAWAAEDQEPGIPGLVISLLFVQYSLALFAAEGWTINAEPFVLLPGLLGAYLIMQGPLPTVARRLTAGMFFGMAVIAKQYGIFFPAAAVLAIVCTADEEYRGVSIWQRLQHLGPILLGSIAIIFCYYSYLASLSPSGLRSVLWSATGKWYKPEPEHFHIYLKQLFAYVPALLVLPFSLRGNLFFRNRLFLFSLFALILSLGQGLIRQYPHYLQHSLPFATLLLAFGFAARRHMGFLLIAVCLSCVSAGYFAFTQFNLFIREDGRAQQKALIQQIWKTVPERSKVMLFGPPSFSYLGRFLPADNFNPGYNFLHNSSPEQMRATMRSADYVLTWNRDYLYFGVLKERFADFPLELREAGFQRLAGIRDKAGRLVVEIYSRNVTGESRNSIAEPPR